MREGGGGGVLSAQKVGQVTPESLVVVGVAVAVNRLRP